MILPKSILYHVVSKLVPLLLSMIYHWNCCLATHNIIHSTINYKYFQVNYQDLICTNNHDSNIINTYTWRYKQDQDPDNEHNAVTIFGSDAENKGNVLTLKNMNATKEGLFWCKDVNDDIVEYFNVTIYGLPQFTGCPNPIFQSSLTCDLGTVYTAATSEAININVSFQYHGTGSRNLVDPITDIRILKPNGDTLMYCTKGKNCVGVDEAKPRINFTYTDRYDIQVSLTNGSEEDNGVYTAKARFTQSVLTSYLTINVTSSVPSSSATSSVLSSYPISTSTVAAVNTLSLTASSSSSSSIFKTTHSSIASSPAASSPFHTPHSSTNSLMSSSSTAHMVSPAVISTENSSPTNIVDSALSPSTNNVEGSPDTKLTVLIIVGCFSGIAIVSIFVLLAICVLKSKTEFASLTKLFPVKDKYETPHTFSDRNSVTNKSFSIRIDNEPIYDRPNNVSTLSQEHNSQQVFV